MTCMLSFYSLTDEVILFLSWSYDTFFQKTEPPILTKKMDAQCFEKNIVSYDHYEVNISSPLHKSYVIYISCVFRHRYSLTTLQTTSHCTPLHHNVSLSQPAVVRSVQNHHDSSEVSKRSKEDTFFSSERLGNGEEPYSLNATSNAAKETRAWKLSSSEALKSPEPLSLRAFLFFASSKLIALKYRLSSLTIV